MITEIFDLPTDHPFSFVQIIGYLGMALGILTFLQKDDVRMKLCLMVMACVMVTHFIMLERFIAAISCTMAGTRAGLSLFDFVRRHAHAFATFFVIVAFFLSYLTYTGWVDLFAFVAMNLGTYAFFYLNGIKLRYAFVVMGLLWLTHNVFAGSYGPAVMEIFILCANFITIYRLHSHEKSDAQSS